MHELVPLCDLDLTTRPLGTAIERTIGDIVFYRVTWLIAEQGATLYYVGDHDAVSQIDRLTGIDDQVARLQQQLAELTAEKETLIAALLPAAPAPATPNAKRAHKPYAKPAPRPVVVCGIDGCTAEKEEGRSLAMHRMRVHPDWNETPAPAPEEVAAEVIPFGPA